MKVAITGSAGFIGSNLVEECLRKGWNVIGLDNFSTGDKEMAVRDKFKDLPGSYQFYQADINCLKDIFIDVDVVFHLAARPRISYSIDHPFESNLANIRGTLSVLEVAKECNVKRIVFSNSSSVYGGIGPFPTKEDKDHFPQSPYALQKHTGSEYCRIYSQLYDIDACSLIYFNVFGKYQRADSAYSAVIPSFIKSAIEGKKCRIDGIGIQSRDFCHVDNIVQANILAAEYEGTLNGGDFNIATSNTYTVMDVFNQVKEKVNKDLEYYNAPAKKGDAYMSLADITKAKRILGYDPEVDFYKGMEKTINWWIGGCRI